jgi:hypothetical protein
MELLNFYEQPFRAKLIPAKVWKDLDRYRNDSVGLTNYVRKWRTKINWITILPKKKSYETNVYVGGEYDPNDRQCILIIYAKDFNTFPFTDYKWDRFKYRLMQTLMHEIIHFMQYDRRDDIWSNYVVPYKKIGIAIVLITILCNNLLGGLFSLNVANKERHRITFTIIMPIILCNRQLCSFYNFTLDVVSAVAF